jgi:hypothetical protein
VKFIKAQRIRWLGHVKRMEAGAMPRRTMEGRLFIGRRKGIPRLRWMDDVVADLRAMKIRQWTEKAEDREQWRRLSRRPRLTQGCSARRMDAWIDLRFNHTERYCYRCVVLNTIHNLMRRNPTVAIQSTGTGTLRMSYTPHPS